jgi:4-hydroxy-3-methylbut-2-en-1-yl diphosphate reductase
MKVLKTRNIGSCFAVKRAIKMVLKEAATTRDTTYTIGPIIHNPHMMNILKEKAVVPVNDVLQIKNGAVVFRTHGVKKDEEEHIRKNRNEDHRHDMYLCQQGMGTLYLYEKNGV